MHFLSFSTEVLFPEEVSCIFQSTTEERWKQEGKGEKFSEKKLSQ